MTSSTTTPPPTTDKTFDYTRACKIILLNASRFVDDESLRTLDAQIQAITASMAQTFGMPADEQEGIREVVCMHDLPTIEGLAAAITQSVRGAAGRS